MLDTVVLKGVPHMLFERRERGVLQRLEVRVPNMPGL